MSHPWRACLARFAESTPSNSTIAWTPFFLKITTRRTFPCGLQIWWITSCIRKLTTFNYRSNVHNMQCLLALQRTYASDGISRIDDRNQENMIFSFVIPMTDKRTSKQRTSMREWKDIDNRKEKSVQGRRPHLPWRSVATIGTTAIMVSLLVVEMVLKANIRKWPQDLNLQ